MKNLLFAVILILSNFCFAFQYQLIQEPQIDSLLTESIKNYKIPGVSLLIVKGDTIIYNKGFGFSNLEDKVKMSPSETVVRCGSISKSFTATAVMILAEKGILDLKAPISEYLNTQELEDFGLKGKKITLHQLLTHSAGFDERLFGSHLKNQSDWKPLKDYFKEYPISFRSEPGQILNYNDQGIALAGYIVEKVSGQPFYDFVKENLFEKLNMTNSSFNPNLPDPIKSKLSKSYFYDGNFTAYNYDYILPYPAAGLVSTPEDIGKFLVMQLQGGPKVLSSNTIDEMHSQQFTNHPKLRGWCYGFAEWKENNRRLVFKDGQATGFNSRLMMLPEEKWGFYLVWNRSVFNKGGSINEANRLKSEVTSFLMDLYFPNNINNELNKPVNYSENDNFDFEGRYSDMGLGNQDWSKILSLAMQIKVSKEGNDSYDISGAKYIRTDKLELQYHTGGDFYAGFTNSGNDVEFLHFGTGSNERVTVFNNAIFQLILLSLFHLSFLSVAIFSFIYVKKRKNRKYYLVLGVGSLLMFLGFPLLNLGFFTVDFQDLYKGATFLMIMSSWLPFIGAAMVIFAAIRILKLKEKKWLIGLSMFNILFILYLIYWNFPII